MSSKKESFLEKLKDKEEKITKFSELLDSLENTEDKKKLLWKEVYENALNDRESAISVLDGGDINGDVTHNQTPVSSYSNAIEVSGDTTLAFDTHCGRPVIQTAAAVFTLPAISGGALGQTFWIINGASDGTLMTISPNSNDKFLWDVAGAAGTDDTDIINTAATAKKGDYVKLSYGSAHGWTIDEMGGTWVDG